MNDIMPPPKKQPPAPEQLPHPAAPPVEAISDDVSVTPLQDETPPRKKMHAMWWIVGLFVAFVAIAAVATTAWYNLSLQPLDAGNKNRIRVQITEGSSPSQIGRLLEDKNLIRHHFAFEMYTRLTGANAKLQAGLYSLSPSESVSDIVRHLTSGNTDAFDITFLPGATLAENRAALIKSGYSESEVDAAFAKPYQHPLFVDKPADADLEGYIYGETYHFTSDASVEEILTKTFDEYYKILKENNLIEALKQQGLNLYQGITVASIVQREVPGAEDQKQAAQIFLKRLSINMPLGSDVTYQYAAKKMGVQPSPELESPYNTRKHTGLPPGPISVPGVSALQAVAQPASGDYLYFLSGDDEKTYFAHTQEEHEANISAHCQVKCSFP